MKIHQIILTAILLVLIGMVAGSAFMVFQSGTMPFTPAEVQITEVLRSSTPAELSEEHTAYPTSIRDVARKVVPTVVYIETTVSGRGQVPDDDNHEFGDEFWDRFVPRGRSSAVGSGVIISSDGYILTNNHVVAGGRDVTVTLDDKRQFDARIVGRDPSTDLAVLKIQGDDLPNIVLGDSDLLEVGDWVMAVGNPLRLKSTITAGIVSALGRDVQIIRDELRIENFIQTDAAINKGNSGGALVNTSGELIGINTAIATESGMNQGYGFAIPINMAFKIGQDLMEFGEVQRAFLGIQIVSVDQRRARQLGMDNIQGVEVASLISGGAAETSGLQSGDVIISINDTEVNEPNQLQAQVAMFRPGQYIDVTLWRNGEIVQKEIELAGNSPAISEWGGNDVIQDFDLEFREQPNQQESENPDSETDNTDLNEDSDEAVSSLSFEQGFTVEMLDMAAPPEPGVHIIVSQVRRFSPARRAGLRADDIILSVNGSRIEGLNHFEEMMDKSDESSEPLSLMVLRDEEIRILEF